MNPYVIILVFFTVAGLAMAAWGWRNMALARKTRDWLATDGIIEESTPASAAGDLMPRIVFSYTVAGRRYQRLLEFPGGTNPSEELAASYVRKYPAGVKVQVFYDPAEPEHATLERHAGHDDWLIVAIGAGAALFGLGALLFSG